MIDQVVNWIGAHWLLLSVAAVILMKALNLVTEHFADYSGVKRWAVFLIDLLDLVKSSEGGIPGSRGRRLR